ncbi:MAG: RNA methyltransferase [Planctomycetes bacterium]|nr:RNA methyltransferase [Planctomycetota bacterium]
MNDSAPDAPLPGGLHDYFAPCTLGLEIVVAEELRALRAVDVEVRRGGVAFRGDRALGYAANLWLRAAVRVQQLVLDVPVRIKEELYGSVAEVEWEKWLDVDGTLAIDASVRDSAITHSGFAALTAKDAICDRFRKRFGRRPNVDTEDPHLPLKLTLLKDRLRLYVNLSGASLHKRGWRPIQVKSPLNEAIAAGLLLASSWNRASPLVDPMCGSGTFVVEAACLAADRAPGLLRRFAFERFPDFDVRAWAILKEDAVRRAKRALPFALVGADRHEGAIALAKRSAREAQVEGLVAFTHASLDDFTPPPPPFTLVTNPPWGERIGEGDDLIASWEALGHFLHRKAQGCHAHVLSGNPDLPRLLGLKASRKMPVMDGPIECRWLRYDIDPVPPR